MNRLTSALFSIIMLKHTEVLRSLKLRSALRLCTGDYQGDVIALLATSELLDIVDDHFQQRRGRAVVMARRL